ncbi:hypothetical protein T484DRAFT_1889334, partial [Baffinella frigidus]
MDESENAVEGCLEAAGGVIYETRGHYLLRENAVEGCPEAAGGFIYETRGHWDFGADGTGDILNPANLRAIRQRTLSEIGRVGLVTADGNATSRRSSSPKRYAYWASLHPAGHSSSSSSRSSPPLLSASVERVSLAKPPCSKQGNSEVYAVCSGFIGPAGVVGGEADEAWERLVASVEQEGGGDVHAGAGGLFGEAWLTRVEQGARLFTRLQTEVMRANCQLWVDALADVTADATAVPGTNRQQEGDVTGTGRQQEGVVTSRGDVATVPGTEGDATGSGCQHEGGVTDRGLHREGDVAGHGRQQGGDVTGRERGGGGRPR